MTAPRVDARADITAARATGVGVGLLVFMLVWTFGVRATEQVWAAPFGVWVAMGLALVVGVVTAVATGSRLAASQRSGREGEMAPPSR
jgi:hypothetical protein